MMFKKLFALSAVLAAGSAMAATTQIDAAASEMKWEGKKVTGQHDGTIKLKSGEVTHEGEKITGGKFEIDMTSIAVSDLKDAEMNKKLVGHLKSDDFFGTDKHPVATYIVKEVKPAAGGQQELVGDLTIKGKTAPLSIPVKVAKQGNKLEATGTAKVDRTKYDVRYGSGKFFQGLGDKVIYDDFTVSVKLVTVAEAAHKAKK